MWVHLLRHGIAVDPDHPAAPTDPERFLTDKGKVRVRAVVKGMAAVGISPDLILVSPYVRAQQTADIAVEVLGASGIPRETIDALTPMGDPSRVIEAVRASGKQSVLCVGHAPNLDLLSSQLLGTSAIVTRLRKAGVATLEARAIKAGAAVLHAVYPPSVLRALGGQ